jgi:2-dehydro-3-deoxyphosphogluconate aldolase / (4S)-4-hydroxy-2-oxoglutarate aldolase
MSDKVALKQPVIDRIISEKVFAVLRLKDTSRIEEIANTIIENGIKIIEITMNSGNALDAMHRIGRNCSPCLLGAGTVLGYESAAQAIENGAKFLVSPVTDLDMLAVGNEIGVTTMAGALTPTEAWQAFGAGADFVKLFPLAGLGPQFIKAIRGPMDFIRYVPTNGVTIENVNEWFDAGASAVGIGSSLVNDEDVANGDLSLIADRVKRVVDSIKR